jgi:uncharacterized protein (TIGR02391 family)
MPGQQQHPAGSTLKQAEEYYTTLDTYTTLVSKRDKLTAADREKANGLRRQLLLGQARMASLLGDVNYAQWGTINSAWDGLQEYQTAFHGFILTGLKVLKDALVVKIGKLRNETVQIQAPEDSAQMSNFLFDRMQFHPKIIEASKSLFETQHYAQAIFEAFKAVNNFVKQKTGSTLDGKSLMTEVFSKNRPIIKLNEGRSDSDKDEQEGFMHLFAGAMLGIRNPKAHDNVIQTDPYRTLEYLGFASLLMTRAEEGKVRRRRKK